MPTPHYRLFVDESYGSSDYYVAGVLVTDAQYDRLAEGLALVKEHVTDRFQAPDDIELHAHRLMQGLDEWTVMRSQLHEAVAVYRHSLRAIVASNAAVWLEGVDVDRLRRRYRYPDSPYEVSLRHLLERVDERCQREDAVCTVTADLTSTSRRTSPRPSPDTPGSGHPGSGRVDSNASRAPSGSTHGARSACRLPTWLPTSCAGTAKSLARPVINV